MVFFLRLMRIRVLYRSLICPESWVFKTSLEHRLSRFEKVFELLKHVNVDFFKFTEPVIY